MEDERGRREEGGNEGLTVISRHTDDVSSCHGYAELTTSQEKGFSRAKSPTMSVCTQLESQGGETERREKEGRKKGGEGRKEGEGREKEGRREEEGRREGEGRKKEGRREEEGRREGEGRKKGGRREEKGGRKGEEASISIVAMSTLASHSLSSPPSPPSPKHTLLTAVQSLRLQKTHLAQTCTCHSCQLVQHKISPVQLR